MKSIDCYNYDFSRLVKSRNGLLGKVLFLRKEFSKPHLQGMWGLENTHFILHLDTAVDEEQIITNCCLQTDFHLADEALLPRKQRKNQESLKIYELGGFPNYK